MMNTATLLRDVETRANIEYKECYTIFRLKNGYTGCFGTPTGNNFSDFLDSLPRYQTIEALFLDMDAKPALFAAQ